MTKLKLGIAQLIVIAVSFVLFFIDGIFYWEHWVEKSPGYLLQQLKMPASILNAQSRLMLWWLIPALLVAVFVFVLVETFSSKQFNILIKVLTIATFAMTIIFMLISQVKDSYGYCVTANTLYWFEIILLLAGVIMSFLKYSEKVVNA